MTMPLQKPGRSEQVVGTPQLFLDAVEARFGKLQHDLAANGQNSVAPSWYGPGSDRPDALSAEPWPAALCWLNPPFARIKPWAERAASESIGGSTILMLVPASVGADWFNEFVRPNAYVLELTPRLAFVGSETPYPKDLILCHFSPQRLVGRSSWRWRP